MEEAEQLARKFSDVLKDWLRADHPENLSHRDLFKELLAEHVKTNAAKEPFCVSHDYCDANQAMIDAWTAVFGKEPEIDVENHPEELVLMNAAWDLAKQNNFYSEG